MAGLIQHSRHYCPGISSARDKNAINGRTRLSVGMNVVVISAPSGQQIICSVFSSLFIFVFL